MALTPSNMLELGVQIPNFELLNVIDNEIYDLHSLKGKNGTLVMFICVHCPYVKHLETHFSELAIYCKSKLINIIAINSNDVANYPQDSPDNMRLQHSKFNFNFPYLYDESQDIAKMFKAACTPDFYLLNADNVLVYRGQYDESRPNNSIEINGKDVISVIESLVLGKTISSTQIPSIGCNIKWKI